MDLYNYPANEFVAGFIGSPRMNMFSVETARAAGWLNDESAGAKRVGVRPEHLVRAEKGLDGRVFYIEHLGGQTLTHLKLPDGTDYTLVEAGQHGGHQGETLTLAPSDGCLHVFDADGRAIRGQ